MLDLLRDVAELAHLLRMGRHDLADLAARQLLAPLTGSTLAEKALGAVRFFPEAMLLFLRLERIEGRSRDGCFKLLWRRAQQEVSGECTKRLGWVLQNVLVAHHVDCAVWPTRPAFDVLAP